ncbi:protein chlororespiratory reduction 7, chloroplastic [Tanacetum coccineum]
MQIFRFMVASAAAKSSYLSSSAAHFHPDHTDPARNSQSPQNRHTSPKVPQTFQTQPTFKRLNFKNNKPKLKLTTPEVKADVIEVPELLANVFGEDSDVVLCATTAMESRRVCNEEELSVRLKGWLENYPGTSLPHDLAIYESVDDVVTSLVKSVCELEIDGDVGSVRWYDLLQNEDHSSNLLLQN